MYHSDKSSIFTSTVQIGLADWMNRALGTGYGSLDNKISDMIWLSKFFVIFMLSILLKTTSSNFILLRYLYLLVLTPLELSYVYVEFFFKSLLFSRKFPELSELGENSTAFMSTVLSSTFF